MQGFSPPPCNFNADGEHRAVGRKQSRVGAGDRKQSSRWVGSTGQEAVHRGSPRQAAERRGGREARAGSRAADQLGSIGQVVGSTRQAGEKDQSGTRRTGLTCGRPACLPKNWPPMPKVMAPCLWDKSTLQVVTQHIYPKSLCSFWTVLKGLWHPSLPKNVVDSVLSSLFYSAVKSQLFQFLPILWQCCSAGACGAPYSSDDKSYTPTLLACGLVPSHHHQKAEHR